MTLLPKLDALDADFAVAIEHAFCGGNLAIVSAYPSLSRIAREAAARPWRVIGNAAHKCTACDNEYVSIDEPIEHDAECPFAPLDAAIDEAEKGGA